MKITLEMIKELRKKTQAGITYCKKALEETQGDVDSAVDILKKKGLFYYKPDKKDTLQGLTNVIVNKNKAILYELNTETDFVTQNKNFIELYNEVGQILLEADFYVKILSDFLKYKWNGRTVEEIISQKAFIIKEQIVLSRIQIVYKKDQEGFGFYKHQGGKISSLVHLSNSSADAEEHLPVHVVAMKPKFLNKDLVDIKFVNQEKENLLEQIKQKNTNKPLNDTTLEKIAVNNLKALIEKNCFLEQPFYMDFNQKVSEYLKQNNTNIIAYYCFEVGKR
ncbi:MAG: translation elongation factor Ts [Phytoplasma sp.]|uniref:translation elongation factor Ts n=1 Tax=Phytoplasma sp. TaxID=2155 RepID=UPI002B409AF1|nr:translation elongation factor Ts [Phytoplasma sp.]WRH06939.1 MAG: translation elongation factor Ts [Phytoplasma sp.]